MSGKKGEKHAEASIKGISQNQYSQNRADSDHANDEEEIEEEFEEEMEEEIE